MEGIPVTEARIARLREYGLSEYAARAYLALLDLGVTEARDVSNLGKVPSSKIYHVLDQLHAKGLVEILPEFPKKYAPLPFASFLDGLARQHETALSSIRLGREHLAAEFQILGEAEAGDRGAFTVLRGRRNSMSKLREFLGATERDLFFFGTRGDALRGRHSMDAVNEAVKRGVRFRILAPVSAETFPILQQIAGSAEVRGRDVENPEGRNVGIYVADGRRALIVTFVPDDGSAVAGKDVGFVTDQSAVVGALVALLEPHWAAAPDLETERRVLEEGIERPFTRVVSGELEVRAAHKQALARGARQMRYASALPQRILADADRVNTRALLDAGLTISVLTNFESEEALESVRQFSTEFAGAIEWRHLDPDAFSRFTIYDDREALFSVGPTSQPSGRLEGEVWIHTNNGATVKALREAFDVRWSRSVPLDKRRQELAAYPHGPPRAVGIGRLFDSIRDAVLVADAQGRILFGNAAAQELFGKLGADLARLRLPSLFPEGLPSTVVVPVGTPDAPVNPVRAQLRDGAALIDVTQTSLNHDGESLTVVMARRRTPLPTP